MGFALHEFADRDPSGNLPQIELVGNRGVAGFYAPLLAGKQFILDSATFFCPSVAAARRSPTLHIPTPEEIDAANEQLLRQYHETMGGDYAYNLGYRDGDRVMPPCNSGRCDYALMSDAPSDSQPGRRSANHGGRGQNVLHGDGHIKFISTVPCSQLPDDPFYNLEGRVGAGLSRADHCLGASSDRP
jgi:hypothetical protein